MPEVDEDGRDENGDTNRDTREPEPERQCEEEQAAEVLRWGEVPAGRDMHIWRTLQ